MTELRIDLPDGIAVAKQSDWRQLTDITAEAFSTDPVNRWAFGSDAGIRDCFRIMARHVYLPSGLCHLAGDRGATMWGLPGAMPRMGFFATLRFAWAMTAGRHKNALARGQHLGALMEAHHPKETHAYLFTVGTRQSARGKGVGKSLLNPILAACDAAELPVYLENSNPENTGFYRSLGFQTVETF
ncbi:MAG: GNAT family N-acetyltransferase, partial [Pseudomonadota bacterium]